MTTYPLYLNKNHKEMPYYFGIVGSRSRGDRQSVYKVLSDIFAIRPDTHISSGGAAGIDTFAEQWMIENGYTNQMHVFAPRKVPQNASYHQRVQAFYARIYDIASVSRSGIIAFVATSRKGGTENTIIHATKLHRPVIALLPLDVLVVQAIDYEDDLAQLTQFTATLR